MDSAPLTTFSADINKPLHIIYSPRSLASVTASPTTRDPRANIRPLGAVIPDRHPYGVHNFAGANVNIIPRCRGMPTPYMRLRLAWVILYIGPVVLDKTRRLKTVRGKDSGDAQRVGSVGEHHAALQPRVSIWWRNSAISINPSLPAWCRSAEDIEAVQRVVPTSRVQYNLCQLLHARVKMSQVHRSSCSDVWSWR